MNEFKIIANGENTGTVMITPPSGDGKSLLGDKR